jgi:hypothetical protein
MKKLKVIKTFNIYYNDGVYYGSYELTNKSRKQIKKILLAEIKDNNKNINKLYHINFRNIKRYQTYVKSI